MIKIAIQKSGRLYDDSIRLLKECGIELNNGNKQLKSVAYNFPLEVYFLRDDDIPQYVNDGVADIGIVGENVLLEKGKDIELVYRLGFGRCRLSVAVPKNMEYQSIEDLQGLKIATTYSTLLNNFLLKNQVSAEIHEISGSVEIAPGIGLADAICDLVSSGSTLFTNGLKEVEVVLQSEAVLASNKNLSGENKKILEKYKSYNLPFKYPFTISKGTKTHQPTLVIELEHFGVKGYGEAPAITYYGITVEKMIEDIEAKRPFIEKFSFNDPERYWHYLHHLFPQNPFLVCALDMAGWDLYGKMRRKQLYELWGLDIANNPVSDFTIGIDTTDRMIAKMKEIPWPVYKIKLGTEDDIGIIKALREHTSSVFRIDANAAWQAAEAMDKINVFKELNIEFIEQPLAKDDWEGMKYLFENSSLPLIADESCVAEQDVQKCYKHFHGINIKLTKCSGITPAKRMIEKARTLDMKVMIGCMNESSIGTAAIAQLLPMVDYADMDGPLLLAEDIGEGVTFNSGKIGYTNSNGIGVVVQPF